MTISKDEVTVVVPTLNEEEAIGMVLDELAELGYKKILVVDGYSKDRTADVAREKGAEVILQYGEGKAGAVRTAIEHVDTPFMLIMDGDGTYDPNDIEALLSHMEDHDQIIGYRAERKNIPWAHRIGNRVISFTFGLLMGKRLSDACSGMYLLRTDRARGLELAGGGFDVEVEIAGQLCSFGKVAEVPISYRRRIGSRKLRTWRDSFNIMKSVLRTGWAYNPAFVLSALVALFAIPGAIILLQQLFGIYLYGVAGWSIGWAWLGLLLLLVGLQGFTISTISLLLKRLERKIVHARGKE